MSRIAPQQQKFVHLAQRKSQLLRLADEVLHHKPCSNLESQVAQAVVPVLDLQPPAPTVAAFVPVLAVRPDPAPS